MKIDKRKYDIAMARTCKCTKDIVNSGIAKGTLSRAVNGEDLKPDTIGRIAQALGVDVAEIIEQKGE